MRRMEKPAPVVVLKRVSRTPFCFAGGRPTIRFGWCRLWLWLPLNRALVPQLQAMGLLSPREGVKNLP